MALFNIFKKKMTKAPLRDCFFETKSGSSYRITIINGEARLSGGKLSKSMLIANYLTPPTVGERFVADLIDSSDDDEFKHISSSVITNVF